MIAVIEIAGKQEIVQEKSFLQVSQVKGMKDKESLSLDKVLLVFTSDGKKIDIGTPYVNDRKVEATVEKALYQGEKVFGGKFKRRKRYTRIFGHRQPMSSLHITKIS